MKWSMEREALNGEHEGKMSCAEARGIVDNLLHKHGFSREEEAQWEAATEHAAKGEGRCEECWKYFQGLKREEPEKIGLNSEEKKQEGIA